MTYADPNGEGPRRSFWWALALAMLVVAAIVIFSSDAKAQRAFTCVKADVFVSQVEDEGDVDVWPPEMARAALAAYPALIDGYDLPIVGAVVVVQPDGSVVFASLVGPWACDAKRVPRDEWRGVRHTVLGVDT